MIFSLDKSNIRFFKSLIELIYSISLIGFNINSDFTIRKFILFASSEFILLGSIRCKLINDISSLINSRSSFIQDCLLSDNTFLRKSNLAISKDELICLSSDSLLLFNSLFEVIRVAEKANPPIKIAIREGNSNSNND